MIITYIKRNKGRNGEKPRLSHMFSLNSWILPCLKQNSSTSVLNYVKHFVLLVSNFLLHSYKKVLTNMRVLYKVCGKWNQKLFWYQKLLESICARNLRVHGKWVLWENLYMNFNQFTFLFIFFTFISLKGSYRERQRGIFHLLVHCPDEPTQLGPGQD